MDYVPVAAEDPFVEYTVRVDLHTHTPGSDGHGNTAVAAPRAAKAAGLAGIAITDHHATFTAAGLHVARAYEAEGLFVVAGCEYSTREGHCLVFGVDVAAFGWGMYPPMQRVLDEVSRAGGFAAPSHPFRGIKATLGYKIQDLRGLLACETHNGQNAAHEPEKDASAQRAAADLGLRGLGGSDAHNPRLLGGAYTLFPAGVRNAAQVLECLRRGWYRAGIDEAILARYRRSEGGRRSPPWFDGSSGYQTTWAPPIRRPDLDQRRPHVQGSTRARAPQAHPRRQDPRGGWWEEDAAEAEAQELRSILCDLYGDDSPDGF